MALLYICAFVAVGCCNCDRGKEGRMAVERTIEQVQEAYTDEWMKMSGVEGTGIGLFDDKPCIKIFTSSKPQEVRAKIPSTVEGYPVIIEETGSFRAID